MSRKSLDEECVACYIIFTKDAAFLKTGAFGRKKKRPVGVLLGDILRGKLDKAARAVYNKGACLSSLGESIYEKRNYVV